MQRISPVLADIAHRDKDHQARAVSDLKRQVLAASKRLPGDALLEFYKQLRGDICNNLMSKNKLENLGAITTIVELIQLEGYGDRDASFVSASVESVCCFRGSFTSSCTAGGTVLAPRACLSMVASAVC